MNQTTTIFRAGSPIDIAGTHNLRSAAGYPAAGGAIRGGSLFRSDALHKLNDAGRASFAAQGIVRVIDLRDDAELANAPSVIAQDPSAATETLHHPILGGANVLAEGEITLSRLYQHIAKDRTEHLVGAVRLIADAPEGGVLINCTAGKDRTGMVIATALAAVGVPRDQIIADYTASADNLAGEWADRMIAGATEQFGQLSDSIREVIIGSPAVAIIDGLDAIDEAHGGVTSMLRTYGFDDAAFERLRVRLVDAA